ncbi:MAG: acyl-CoA carboxylase subunit beta [Bacillota bacterium]
MNYKEGEERLKEAVLWVEGRGREKQIKRHRESGRLLIRERLALLLDEGSWLEYGKYAHSSEPGYEERSPMDAIVTGIGRINGREVVIVGEDKTVMGGTHGVINFRKVERIIDVAFQNNFPIVSLSEGGGGRIPDLLGVGLCHMFGLSKQKMFYGLGNRMKRPLFICAVFGPSYGDPAIRAAMADVTIIVSDSAVALSGPPLVEAATGGVVGDLELGGPEVHKETGIVDIIVDTEAEALQKIKEILHILRPGEASSDPPDRPVPELQNIVPEDHREGYDMGDFIRVICDHGEWMELKSYYGVGVITALGRMGGRRVAFLASQPQNMGGVIDARALRKMSDFVTFASKERIPLIVLQDVPGLLIGRFAEREGLLRELVSYISTLAGLDNLVMQTLVIRKAYGVAYFFMGIAATGSQCVAAWSTAEIGFLAPEAGAAILLKNTKGDNKAAIIKKTAAEFRNKASVWYVAGEDYIDAVILPAETRSHLCRTLDYIAGGYGEGS